MEEALRAVSNNDLSLRQAANQFNVPKSTLHDRISGRVKPGAVPGAPRYLNEEEEEEVVWWLEGCAEIGYAKTVREVRGVVGAIVASKNNLESVVVSHGWWDRFRSRHPRLTLRTGEGLAYRRAVGTNRIVIDKYFDLLEEVLKVNDLTGRPHLIFNADETGLPLQHRPGKRVAVRRQKHVNVINSGNKSQVTVLACASATGYALPPMVVFQRKNLTTQLTSEEVPGTIYGLSSSGWMDGDLFQEWFRRHFLQFTPSARPLLLLLDGHSSHYNLEFIREASSQGVIVFCLPPNTTHVCQPLDVTTFHSLKAFWDHECDEFMSANPGKIVTLYQFSSLFSATWAKAMVPKTIASGFKAAGVFPLDRRAIKIPGENPAVTNTPTAVLARREGIKFMPFLSRARKLVPESDKETSGEVTRFSEEEEAKFTRRYENGYDLLHDCRYNEWLSMHHLEHTPQTLLARELHVYYSPSPDSSLISYLYDPLASPQYQEHPTETGNELQCVIYTRTVNYLHSPPPPADHEDDHEQMHRQGTGQDLARRPGWCMAVSLLGNMLLTHTHT